MRNLFQLLRRYQLFLAFLALQFICFLLIFNYNSFPKATFLSSTNSVVGYFSERASKVTNYFSLAETNERLQAQIDSMRLRTRSPYINKENSYVLLGDSIFDRQYRFLSTNVVQSTIFQKRNYITIDRGKTAKVEPGMGVLSTNGIIGKVIKSTKHYALVMPVIHSQFTLDVVCERTGNSGPLTWKDETDYRYAKVENITKDTPLEVGDKFITRDGSKLFPGGIDVGEIVEIYAEPGDNFHTIRILMNTDFSNLRKATVVINKYQPEMDSLQVEMQ